MQTNNIKKKHGAWLVLAAAVLWGTTGTAQALAPAGAHPLSIGAVRLAIGGFALLIVALMRGSFQRGRAWPVKATFLAAACMAGYQPLFFAGVARTGVAAGTMVTIGSSPVLAGGLAWLLLGEKPGRRWLAATVLAVIGCGLLAAESGEVSVDLSGILFSLGAGVCYASYALVSKGLLEKQTPDAVMAVVFTLGALFLAPVLLGADMRWLAQPGGLAAALHLGLVATAAAYALFGRGLQLTPVATAVSLSLAEPLTAALLGLLLLGERLTAPAWLGIGLLFAGLALLSR